eukprot:47273-Eustigmatos_ZCMA.PRE.1
MDTAASTEALTSDTRPSCPFCTGASAPRTSVAVVPCGGGHDAMVCVADSKGSLSKGPECVSRSSTDRACEYEVWAPDHVGVSHGRPLVHAPKWL